MAVSIGQHTTIQTTRQIDDMIIRQKERQKISWDDMRGIQQTQPSQPSPAKPNLLKKGNQTHSHR